MRYGTINKALADTLPLSRAEGLHFVELATDPSNLRMRNLLDRRPGRLPAR